MVASLILHTGQKKLPNHHRMRGSSVLNGKKRSIEINLYF